MITLMFRTYAAICIVVFKLFRVRASTWTISTAVLGGLFGVGGLLIALNYNQPFTPDARILFYTTPIFSTVIGRVVEVPITPNVPIKKDDVLLQLDPALFQDTVDQKKAQLAQSRQNVRMLKAAVGQAEGEEREAQAARDRAKQAYDRYAIADEEARRRQQPPPFSDLQEANERATDQESVAKLSAAKAATERARFAFESAINGVNTDVARVGAELRHAEFELTQATIRAPTDGFATQLFLRPGMAAVPMPIRPIMVFVHTDQTVFASSFPQNVVQRIEPNNEVEIAFDGVPGRIFRGKVARLVDSVAQGQLQPSGDLVLPEQRSQSPGKIVAIIQVLDDYSSYRLPPGSTAQVAVYTDHWSELALVRRILLRMKSWMNYVTAMN
ncbi:HlyD family secretion protein [Bradyrhizobium stylosanthis]|uniref:HlyD family secretion protein n=1 Tax=Bradyrhizobium stylosanthis TaxID=1803665 RepID=UPI0007C584A4|nr:biotin/lipoyl-binding protein [Bradyrhizobium stylosanthis]